MRLKEVVICYHVEKDERALPNGGALFVVCRTFQVFNIIHHKGKSEHTINYFEEAA